jgi:hypothetical protein
VSTADEQATRKPATRGRWVGGARAHPVRAYFVITYLLFIIAANTALMVEIAFLGWPSKTTVGASSDGFRCATPPEGDPLGCVGSAATAAGGRMDPYVEKLRDSDNPSIAYRAHRRLDGQGEGEENQRRRRQQVAETSNVRRLLSHRGPDGTIRLGNEYHGYRKFQGAHWTMAALAELGYPPGDQSLLPVVDQVHEWLSSPKHLSPPSTQVIPGQEDRVRRCASQEGLTIWYLHELGLVDERVDMLVSRLVDDQWPDGGWNCDKAPAARTSSVQETLLPLRGLARHIRSGQEAPAARDAVDRAAQFLLDRRLLWRRHDRAPIQPAWGRDPMRIQWPIRFYDILSALTVMAEIDRVDNPGCADALGILAAKRLKTGGHPAEVRTAKTVDTVTSGGTFADWGPTGRAQANPYVSIDATWVLRKAAHSDVADR